MKHNIRNRKRYILGVVMVLIALLALAIPAQASEFIPPPLNLQGTPTIEVNPDAHHHDHSNLEGPAPISALELAASTCSGGMAAEYPCQGIDFMSRVALSSFPGSPTSASNLWGYVDLDDNREYAVIGLRNGTGVVDVTDPVNPVIVGHIAGVNSQWRELKVYQFWNASSQPLGRVCLCHHGRRGWRDSDHRPDPTAQQHLARWHMDWRIHLPYRSDLKYQFHHQRLEQPTFPPILYISGANTGGLRFVSLANPTSLTEVGFWTGTYSHDTYPHVFTDARANQCAPGHNPCEVVFSFAGTAGLKIIDVTNKSAPVTLSTLTYSQLGYVHSGWISKRWQLYFPAR